MKILRYLLAPSSIWFYLNLALINSSVSNWATQAILAISVILNIGSAISELFGLKPTRTPIRTLLASSFGICVIMFYALALSFVGPALGVTRPLDSVTVKPVTEVLLFVITILVLSLKGDSYRWLSASLARSEVLGFLLLIPLPLAAVVGAFQLNQTNNNLISFYTMIAISITIFSCCIFGLLKSKNFKQTPLVIGLIGSSALALFWSTSLRGAGLFGWDVQKEYAVATQTIANGIFSLPKDADAYASMASLTAFPAYLHSLTGMTAMDITRWLFPLAIAIACAGIVAAIGEIYGDGPAVVSFTLLVIATASMARQFPAIGRQELALMLFAALVYLVAGKTEGIRPKQVGMTVLGAGIGITHYTTAYVTVFFLVLALLVRYIFNHRIKAKKVFAITAPVVGLIVIFVVGWNAVITRPASELIADTSTTSSSGLQFLDNGQKNPLMAWIVGTSATHVPVKTYEEALFIRRDETMPWLKYDHRADSQILQDSNPTENIGSLAKFTGVWSGIVILLRQTMNLIAVGLIAATLLNKWRRKTLVHLELFAVALSAVLLVILLRVSSTLALLYNPERGAIQAGFVFAFVLAAGIHYLISGKNSIKEFVSKKKARGRRSLSNSRKTRRTILATLFFAGWITVNIISTLGIQQVLFKGSPQATYANVGEDNERFKISKAELATSSWMKSNFGNDVLVYSDRYGELVLMSVQSMHTFRTLNIIDPKAVDKGGLIYASKTNIVKGRARGCVNNLCSTWIFTKEFYDQTRPVIFATEETRVYGRTY